MHFHASYDSLSCRRRLFIFYRKFYTPCKNIHIDPAAVVEEYCRLKANMRRMTSLHPCNVERDARVKNVARWHAVFLLMVRHRCQCRFVKYLMKVIAFFDSYKQNNSFWSYSRQGVVYFRNMAVPAVAQRRREHVECIAKFHERLSTCSHQNCRCSSATITVVRSTVFADCLRKI